MAKVSCREKNARTINNLKLAQGSLRPPERTKPKSPERKRLRKRRGRKVRNHGKNPELQSFPLKT